MTLAQGLWYYQRLSHSNLSSNEHPQHVVYIETVNPQAKQRIEAWFEADSQANNTQSNLKQSNIFDSCIVWDYTSVGSYMVDTRCGWGVWCHLLCWEPHSTGSSRPICCTGIVWTETLNTHGHRLKQSHTQNSTAFRKCLSCTILVGKLSMNSHYQAPAKG